MKRLTLVLGLLGVLLATAVGQGNFLKVGIPFEFVAGGETCPAGRYEFAVTNRNMNQMILMTNSKTGKSIRLSVLSRIVPDVTPDGRARISFDVQEGKRFIEAIWPWKDDGYVIHNVEGQQTHEIIRLKD